MSEKKKDPPQIDLSAPFWGIPIYSWLILIILVISLVVSIYAVTRR